MSRHPKRVPAAQARHRIVYRLTGIDDNGVAVRESVDGFAQPPRRHHAIREVPTADHHDIERAGELQVLKAVVEDVHRATQASLGQ
jgi:hypothetical protein